MNYYSNYKKAFIIVLFWLVLQCCVHVSASSSSSSSSGGASPFPFYLVRELEIRLKNHYGDAEVSALRQMIKDFNSASSDLAEDEEKSIRDTLNAHFGPAFYSYYQQIQHEPAKDSDTALIQNTLKLMKQQFHKLREICEKHVKPQWSHFLAVAAVSRQLQAKKADVPCSDQASCKKLEHLVNRCNYARQGAMVASNIFSTVTHVLNGLMSLMCGCLFVGPVHKCVLKNFPYTCKLPYPVYASLYMGTSQVWEVVKATSNMCRLYGDPGLASVVQ